MQPLFAPILPEVFAVVPVKRFALAKQRLSVVLSRSERTKLALVMFHDVLMTLRAVPAIAGIIVVSDDPAAKTLAADAGARIVSDFPDTDINNAILRGLKSLDPARMGALVVPADVPFATVDEIGEVAQALYHHPLVLVPAVMDGGTNALAARSPIFITPCFGENSFHRHRAAARRRHLDYGVIRAEGLGRDIDRPDDLISQPALCGHTMTAALLRELNVSSRLAVDTTPFSARSS